MEYDSQRAEAMIAAAFDPGVPDRPFAPPFWPMATVGSAPYQDACNAVAPLVPRLSVPEVLSVAAGLIGSVSLTEEELTGTATAGAARAEGLLDALRAEGYSAREIANIGATLLAGLVRLFPG